MKLTLQDDTGQVIAEWELPDLPWQAGMAIAVLNDGVFYSHTADRLASFLEALKRMAEVKK